ncbi:MAG: DUF1684 domain-containing protein [bacterium]|nr:DUF1684 domain-containing protein [bacterium]
MRKLSILAGLALFLTPILSCSQQSTVPDVDPSYLAETDLWHAQRIERLADSSGWLTVVGLHWIEEGESTFGTAADNTVILPEGAGASHAGSIFLEEGALRVEALEDVDLKLNDAPTAAVSITSDADGPPDMLTLNDIMFFVIQRGDRYAVRVKDPNSEARQTFHGVERFPVNPNYRFEADFVPFDPPQERQVPTVIGTPASYLVPGVVRFEIDGVQYELEPVISSLESPVLFFIFGDASNGVDTYGAGRFLYADREADGKVLIDFNKATNPPCAFTPYATCPLPTPQNRLAVRIEAGELGYGDH